MTTYFTRLKIGRFMSFKKEYIAFKNSHYNTSRSFLQSQGEKSYICMSHGSETQQRGRSSSCFESCKMNPS